MRAFSSSLEASPLGSAPSRAHGPLTPKRHVPPGPLANLLRGVMLTKVRGRAGFRILAGPSLNPYLNIYNAPRPSATQHQRGAVSCQAHQPDRGAEGGRLGPSPSLRAAAP